MQSASSMSVLVVGYEKAFCSCSCMISFCWYDSSEGEEDDSSDDKEKDDNDRGGEEDVEE